MAEALGNIQLIASYEKPFTTLTYEDFEENYQEELLELLNDDDNTVKLKALISAGKLSKSGYISVHTF